MKKKLLVFCLIIAAIIALSIVAFAADEQITITYYQTSDTFSSSPQVDTVNRKVTIEKGAEIVLPLESQGIAPDETRTLMWFTADGRAWEAGSTVSFTENTALYRILAIDAANETEYKSGVDTGAVRLVKDIDSSNKSTGTCYVFLNGKTLNITGGNEAIGGQRVGVHFMGKGTVNYTGNDKSAGKSYFLQMKSHGYSDSGKACKFTIGSEVTVNAPNSHLFVDYEGTGVSGYPYGRIYGKVNVYSLGYSSGTIDKTPKLDIFETAEIKLYGDKIAYNPNCDLTWTISVQGGLFLLPEAAKDSAWWSTEVSGKDLAPESIAISGGVFLNAGSNIAGYVADSVKEYQVVDNGLTYIALVPNNGCEHNYTVTDTVTPTCQTLASSVYTCSVCGNSFTVKGGDPVDHRWEKVNEIAPTLTTAGVIYYDCYWCEATREEYYYLDIADEYIEVTVFEDTKVSVKVRDVFELTDLGDNTYEITGLKDFGEYSVDNITSVSIPIGVKTLNFNQNNDTLTKIDILDGANVTINSFSKFTAVTEINIGASTVIFKTGCSNNSIKSIYSNKEGAYVSYETKVFSGKLSLENVTFSTNSDYILAGEAFGDCTSIKEIILPDYSRPQFTGSAFWQNNIEYIYVGRGIKSLNNDPFNRNYKLKKAILMEVNSFPNGWTFCYSFDWANDNDPTTGPAEIYIHSDTLSLANDAFYQSHGITVYTNAPITSGNAFSGCQSKTVDGVTYPAYTIVYGIGHKLVEATSEAESCTEMGLKGYKGDCPCGEFVKGSVTVKVFTGQKTNSNTYEEITYTTEEIPGKGHTEGTILSIAYNNGYMSKGTKTCICADCSNEYVEAEPTAEALFEFLGYSMPENGDLSITIGFIANNNAIAKYEELTKVRFEYGVVAAIASKLDGKAPLDESLVNVPVVKATIDNKYPTFDFIISGFNAEQLDLEVVMAAYVIDGDSLVYLQDTQTDLPVSISINKYLADKAPVIPPEEEETPAA